MGVYERLGVRPVINAAGTLTMLGGSRPAPEVLKAMAEAAESFVIMTELHEAAGKIVANITGAEAGLVTSGAAAGLVLMAAACITGKDEDKMLLLPHTEAMNNEIIVLTVQESIHFQEFSAAGAVLIKVGTHDGYTFSEIEDAITVKTVGIAFFFFTGRRYCNYDDLAEVIKIGKKHDIPVIVDAAAELPPVENLRRLIALGADLVAFSGGKAIQGPNDTGFICGRKELVEAAAMQVCPHRGIGRGHKVSKEAIIGFVTATQSYVAEDHKIERMRWESKVKFLLQELAGIPYTKVEQIFPDPQKEYYAQCWPRLRVTWDEVVLGLTVAEVREKLKEGNPRIVVGGGGNAMTVNPHLLRDGEEKLIADRLREILRE